MGVAGIVLGGALDKELRDFEATQARRREMGGVAGDFAVVVVEGYGKVGHGRRSCSSGSARTPGRMASLFGDAARLYVYDADPPPRRRVLPRAGNRVVGHRRPYAGCRGRAASASSTALHATPGGVAARSGVVRFDDGRTAVVPLANLSALERQDA